jgi:hypothetical protein
VRPPSALISMRAMANDWAAMIKTSAQWLLYLVEGVLTSSLASLADGVLNHCVKLQKPVCDIGPIETSSSGCSNLLVQTEEEAKTLWLDKPLPGVDRRCTLTTRTSLYSPAQQSFSRRATEECGKRSRCFRMQHSFLPLTMCKMRHQPAH